jgi:hypothetical protein
MISVLLDMGFDQNNVGADQIDCAPSDGHGTLPQGREASS